MPIDRYDFYKTLYLNELERREKQESRMNTPLAVLVLLGGLLSLFVREYRFGEFDLWEIVFLFLTACSLVSYGIAILFLVRSYHSKEYRLAVVSPPAEFERWREELVQTVPESEVDARFELGVLASLEEPTTYNRQINDQKGAYFYKAKTYLIATTILCGLCLIPFSIRSYEHGEAIYKVELVRGNSGLTNGEQYMPDTKSQSIHATPKSAGESQQTIKQPPPPPPTVYIQESSGKPVSKPTK